MPRKYILLVDDNPRDVELTLAAISRLSLDIDIEVVNDGDQALDYLYCRNNFADRQSGWPALVLLDLKMPKVHGLDVLRQIKSDPDLLSIPFVVLSSSEQDRDIFESYDYGANAYVVKPIDFSEFTQTIKTIFHFWMNVSESVKPKSSFFNA